MMTDESQLQQPIKQAASGTCYTKPWPEILDAGEQTVLIGE